MIFDNINRISINDFLESKIQAPKITTHKQDSIPVEYSLNKFGYRSKEFKSGTKMLTLGCSQTFGDGLPYDQAWPSLLAKKMGVSHDNLAQGGESSVSQIIKAFYYFEKFGNPEIIVGLFPLYRMTSIYVEDKMASSFNSNQDQIRKWKDKSMAENIDLEIGEFSTYSKAPHSPEEVIPQEMSFFYESAMIDLLRQYCKTNKIKLVWSIWHRDYVPNFYEKINSCYPERHEDYLVIESFNYNYKNVKGIDNFLEDNLLDCHQENRNDPMFYRAADTVGKRFPHWGLHKHIHIAEDFYKHITLTDLN